MMAGVEGRIHTNAASAGGKKEEDAERGLDRKIGCSILLEMCLISFNLKA